MLGFLKVGGERVRELLELRFEAGWSGGTMRHQLQSNCWGTGDVPGPCPGCPLSQPPCAAIQPIAASVFLQVNSRSECDTVIASI